MRQLLPIFCVLVISVFAQPAIAEVAVLANRSVSSITVGIVSSGELPKNLTIYSGDSHPVFFERSLLVRFGEGLELQQFAIQPSNAYFFSRGADGQTLQLEQIGLGEKTAKTSKPSPSKAPVSKATQPVTVTVKLLVDDNEPTHRRVWEPKLRKRVAKASGILERHSGVRLKVVEVTTWESDEKQPNFGQILREFERSVPAAPAQLVIGFSSQFQYQRGSHLGVTRWPLHSHILIRERSRNLLETERLELLVHELGHYLGASHSPEPFSVMRPKLTRGPQRGVGSRIQFDPVNALLVALTGEEMRRRNVRHMKNLSKPTVKRMKEIYGVLQQAMPSDPAASQYIRVLDRMTAIRQAAAIPTPRNTTTQPRIPGMQSRSVAPLVRDTRQILDHLQKVAQAQLDSDEEMVGDELTNLYVRQAASHASRLRSSNAERALILALGIFLDDSTMLQTFPGTAKFVGSVESSEQRAERLRVKGKPTMRERTDLTKHFFVSAHLVVAIGKEAAIAAGLAKETLDSQGGTGFSFVDMAANRSGIIWAERLLAGELELRDVARDFHVDDYLPTLVGLEEGIAAAEMQAKFGGDDQPTINELLLSVEQRVLNLPVYDQAK